MGDDESSGRVRGATEALSVLHSRPRGQQPPIRDHALALLAAHVNAGAWNAAGLPALGQQATVVPASDEAVIRLARLVISMHCKDMPVAERPAIWSRLESFFARRLPSSAPQLVRLREVACRQRLDAGRTPPDIDLLKEILEFHRQVHGEDSYLAGLTRGNLSAAYRAAGDFARAAALLHDEARARASRYGDDHPVTLVTRSMLAQVLLLEAEAAGEAADRLTLAQRALNLISDVRAARDRIYGPTAPNATRSRRYEAHALLLLGELDRARACLEHALTFDISREGRQDLYSIGQTHLLLGRVCAAQGSTDQALEHAEQAQRILSAHIPQGSESGKAAALARDIARRAVRGLDSVGR
jgi:tetratricopeptide (TPR) repeat protein